MKTYTITHYVGGDPIVYDDATNPIDRGGGTLEFTHGGETKWVSGSWSCVPTEQ